MGANTKIEWTDATWNPLRGCSRVSEGCRNCYAERDALRWSGDGQPFEGLAVLKNGHASWTGKVEFIEKHLLDPLRWRPGRPIYDAETGKIVGRDPAQSLRIFVNSVSDLFHESVPDEWIDRIFAVMALCPQHTFQCLTKRPERMLAYMESRSRSASFWKAAVPTGWTLEDFNGIKMVPFPLPNVWLGTSVENQDAADERLPILAKVPCRVRFVSCEPLLGALDITRWISRDAIRKAGGSWTSEQIDWAICGGESGPGARPMNPDWVRSLIQQCAAAGVPFFFKQWGEWAPGSGPDPRKEIPIHSSGTGLMHRAGKKAAGALLDGVEHKAFPVAR